MTAWRGISVELTLEHQKYVQGMKRAGTATDELSRSTDGLTTTTDGLSRSTRDLDKATGDLNRRFDQQRDILGAGVLAATAAGLWKATDAASDLRESQAAANVVFGDSIGIIDDFAKTSAQSIGLSKQETLDATSRFGDMFAQIGIGKDRTAELSKQLVILAADFGSLKNADPTAIIEAQQSAFRGEYDALQRYVPTISAAAVEQRALADTGKSNADSLTAQEKALATYEVMLDGAGAAVGDFARSNGSAATEAKKAAAEAKNSAASMGKSLLPIYARVSQVAGAAAQGFGKLPPPIQTATVATTGLGLATVLLAPRIKETVDLVREGRQRLSEWASGMAQAGSSTRASAVNWAAGTGALTALGAGLYAVNMVLTDQANRTAELDAKYKAFVTTVTEGGQDFEEAAQAALMKDYAGFSHFEDAGLSFKQYRDLVLGSQADFDAWYADQEAKAGGSKAMFASAAQDVAAARNMYAAAREETDRYARAKENAAQADVKATEVVRTQTAAMHLLAAGIREAARTASESALSAAPLLANRELAESFGTLADAIDETEQAQERLDSAQRSAESTAKGIVTAQRSLEQSHRGLAASIRGEQDAAEDVQDALTGQTDAQLALVDAQQELVDGSPDLLDAQKDLEEAGRRLQEQQESETEAQDRLTEARENYQDTLKGLASDAGAAADDVLSAEIRLRKARTALANLGSNGDAVTADDRLSAQIDVREAERALEAARARSAEAQATLNRETQAGVDGSTAVVEAQEAVEQAHRDTIEAQDAQADAAGRVADAQEAAARKVEEAQDAVADANDRVADAQQRLVDARQAVVDANRAIEDAADGVAEAQRAHRDALREVNEAQDELVARQDDVDEALRGVSEGIGAVHQQLQTPWRAVLDVSQPEAAIADLAVRLAQVAVQAGTMAVTGGLADAFGGGRSARGPKSSAGAKTTAGALEAAHASIGSLTVESIELPATFADQLARAVKGGGSEWALTKPALTRPTTTLPAAATETLLPAPSVIPFRNAQAPVLTIDYQRLASELGRTQRPTVEVTGDTNIVGVEDPERAGRAAATMIGHRVAAVLP